MRRQTMRVRLDERGDIEIVDPGYDSLELLRAVDPEYGIPATPLPGFAAPRIRAALQRGMELPAHLHAEDSVSWLAAEDSASLWAIHRTMLHRGRRRESFGALGASLSLLDLKIELAQRILARCTLCAHRCGVDRIRGELGVCRLGTEAVVAEHFVHIAEEGFINPSLIVSLAGCGLRCRFCQQGPLLTPAAVPGEALDADLWSRLDIGGARSLSFVGGNPDESLYAILRFLKATPADWNLPIVWNCHAYGTVEAIRLLDGIVDAYVPDFKYGNDECGRRLSGVTDYPSAAAASVAAMLEQRVPVIARILVLPGHFECCHAPALRYLAATASENLFVSIRGQYCPDWKMAVPGRGGPLTRRVASHEVEAVTDLARHLKLNLVV